MKKAKTICKKLKKILILVNILDFTRRCITRKSVNYAAWSRLHDPDRVIETAASRLRNLKFG